MLMIKKQPREQNQSNFDMTKPLDIVDKGQQISNDWFENTIKRDYPIQEKKQEKKKENKKSK